MAKLSKRMKLLAEKVTVEKNYEAIEAFGLLKSLSSVKFNEAVDVAINLGADVPFLRPKKLSTDKTKSSLALIHAVKFMEKQEPQNIRQKRRNRAILAVLIGMVALFYIISVVRMGISI